MARHSDIVYDPALKNCKDCIAEFEHCQRPAPYAGPRCRTHMLAKRNIDRRNSHRSTVEKKYNLPPGGYDQLKEYQDGACGICQKGKGISKNLAVDHDHKHCDECKGNGSCGKGIRGLLCGRCNSLLAHIRDDLATARRIFHYLEDPPYQRMTRASQGLPVPSWYYEEFIQPFEGLLAEPPYTGTESEDQG